MLRDNFSLVSSPFAVNTSRATPKKERCGYSALANKGTRLWNDYLKGTPYVPEFVTRAGRNKNFPHPYENASVKPVNCNSYFYLCLAYAWVLTCTCKMSKSHKGATWTNPLGELSIAIAEKPALKYGIRRDLRSPWTRISINAKLKDTSRIYKLMYWLN